MKTDVPTPGSVRISSIVDQLDAPLPYAAERLRRLAISFRYPVQDTVAGYAIQAKDAEALTVWLRAYTAIRPIWEVYCSDQKMAINPAEYHKFLNTVRRKNYTVCRNHPRFYSEEYVSGNETDVLLMIRILYADENEVALLGYMPTRLAGARLGVSETAMEEWLTDHPTWISTIAGVPFVKTTDVDILANEWGRCVDAESYDWIGLRDCLDEEAYRQFHRQASL